MLTSVVSITLLHYSLPPSIDVRFNDISEGYCFPRGILTIPWYQYRPDPRSPFLAAKFRVLGCLLTKCKIGNPVLSLYDSVSFPWPVHLRTHLALVQEVTVLEELFLLASLYRILCDKHVPPGEFFEMVRWVQVNCILPYQFCPKTWSKSSCSKFLWVLWPRIGIRKHSFVDLQPWNHDVIRSRVSVWCLSSFPCLGNHIGKCFFLKIIVDVRILLINAF